jgi:hypothetical protein
MVFSNSHTRRCLKVNHGCFIYSGFEMQVLFMANSFETVVMRSPPCGHLGADHEKHETRTAEKSRLNFTIPIQKCS